MVHRLPINRGACMLTSSNGVQYGVRWKYWQNIIILGSQHWKKSISLILSNLTVSANIFGKYRTVWNAMLTRRGSIQHNSDQSSTPPWSDDIENLYHENTSSLPQHYSRRKMWLLFWTGLTPSPTAMNPENCHILVILSQNYALFPKSLDRVLIY